MTHDIAGAARSLQASASKRQFGAGIPSKKINVCPEIACDKDAVVNRIAWHCPLQRPLSKRRKGTGHFEQIRLGLIRLEVPPLPPLYRQNAVRVR
jgi:hypothetical protein